MKVFSPQGLRDYYLLTKPGIIRGNVLTGIGGFFLAAKGHMSWWTLLTLVIGMTLVIGSACVFNNYLDRNIDRKMARTKSRLTARGDISGSSIVIFGGTLLVFGTIVLIFGTNLLTTVLGLVGFVSYAFVYTPAKHRTAYATLIGTIPGAVPPVAGYTALSNRLDMAALLLFVILVCWQMPHFYAIAIRRLDEYKAAGVPVWPLVHGVPSTRWQMLLYTIGFLLSCVALTALGYSGYAFAVIMLVFGVYWLYLCLKGWRTHDQTRWAKSVFLMSLPILPLFCLLLIANHWLI